ncbi:polysaccharide deacetylase family protein [Subtercola sp. YIM 133946]|uniref:polysaccharide deacetylase family protein n=1 Tax=Subtercola sp. YIM 133946 TaxID=3118909 RepID=UPI002F9424F0
MDRRLFLTIAAAGASALTLSACARESPVVFAASSSTARPTPTARATPTPTPSPTPTPTPTPTLLQTPPALERVPLPDGVISDLPGDGNLLAWTVDDGTSGDVIRKYVEFAASTGTRLTFFVNGTYSGWTENAALLRPLVASGQIQLGNHTWDHADLTSISDDDVIDELQKNHDFILSTYGVDARPYYRPPYGFRNHHTDRLAASIGYTAPVLWYGSLSDSSLITDQQVVDFATQWFLPQHVVIGHLNYGPVTEVFGQLMQIIQSRGLQTVTLNDVFTA